jgi:hypothetical protein
MPDPTQYTIVPWVRRGLASRITGQTQTNFASLPVALTVNGTILPGPTVRLVGPGQVTALDSRAVVRTDPRDGAATFEPNYLPMVELAQPDLPWMFTPSAPVNGRLQPWICLVVVPAADGIEIDAAPGGISILRIKAPLDPKAELPDLSSIDAWAHAQITGKSLSGNDLNNAFDGDPATTVSRLVAARKLEANQSYIACIVPTFRAGVNAALGLPVDDQDLAPAWDESASAPLTIPAYYVFRFHTGAEGDFASLARKITPPKSKLDAGTRIMDVSQPGFGVAGVAGTTLGLEGALKTVDNQSTPWPPSAQAVYEAQFRAVLAPPASSDPVFAPPTYGSIQSGSGLPAAGATPVWLGELNLDPRSRAAAAAGSQIVQRDQEALVASAWNQLGEIRKANQLLRQAQLARQVLTSMSQRHLERIAGDGQWLQVTAPLHSRVKVTLSGVTATMYGQVRASRIPDGSFSAAMRRMARPAGPIGRQLKPGVPQLVERLNQPPGSAMAIQVAGPIQPPKGMVAMDDVSPDFQVKNMTAVSVVSAGGWKFTATADLAIDSGAVELASSASPISTTGPQSIIGTDGPIKKLPLIDWKSNPNLPAILTGTISTVPAPIIFPSASAALEAVKANFKTVAQSINTYLNTAPAAPPDPAPLGGQATLGPARQQLLAKLNPGDTIRARFAARIPLNNGADPLQPLEAGPKYPQAMYAPLAQLSPDWILPGISKIEPDCAALLTTNARFIESYMIGLNDELSRELLWREFPVDRRVTFFQDFWGAPAPDIRTIGSFDAKGDLGSHVTNGMGGTQFVLLIRATIFQRYPNAMVYAAQGQWKSGVRILTDTVQYPIFRGDIGADVTFFGFDISDPQGSPDPARNNAGWYFVIAEHITEPRVGLEPDKSARPTGFWNDLSWQDVSLQGNYIDVTTAPTKPANESVVWSGNSASLGYILVRRPVRVALHALALLGEKG